MIPGCIVLEPRILEPRILEPRILEPRGLEPGGPGVYYARAVAIEKTTGDTVCSAIQNIIIPKDGDKMPSEAAAPVIFRDEIRPAGPNPTQGEVRLAGTAAGAGLLTLHVYDVNGRQVQTVERRLDTAGPFEMVWDGREEGREKAPAGVYFLDLSRDGERVGKDARDSDEVTTLPR